MLKKVEWYEEALKNRIKSNEVDIQRLENIEKDIHRNEQEIAFLQMQIKEAKKRKKDSFDAYKFLVPIKKKEV